VNHRQRIADMNMAYLGKAWRLGFDGPRAEAKQTGIWDQIFGLGWGVVPELCVERVLKMHNRWIRVAEKDEYLAALLKMHYRDEIDFPDKEIKEALDAFGGMI